MNAPAWIPNNYPHPRTPTRLQHLALPGVADAIPPPHRPRNHHHRHHRQPAASAHIVAHISRNNVHYTGILSKAHCDIFTGWFTSRLYAFWNKGELRVSKEEQEEFLLYHLYIYKHVQMIQDLDQPPGYVRKIIQITNWKYTAISQLSSLRSKF